MLIALVPVAHLSAQADCDCKSDLNYLNRLIQKTPAYKARTSAYTSAYNAALAQASDKISLFNCFELINTVLLSLEDWHLTVIEASKDEVSEYQTPYPVYKGPLEDLEEELRQKPESAIEGIYHIGGRLLYGLVFNAEQNRYLGVVLDSQTDLWSRGDVILKLIPVSQSSFKLIGAQFPTKRLISYTERINQGMFLRSGFRKDTSITYYNRTPYPKEQFLWKNIDPEIDYIKVGSFSSYYPLLGEAEAFYKHLEGQPNKPHLILDLRDNGGGGDRNSDLLYKVLKPYLRKNSLHVITNASTGSNAEQFVLKLKEFDRVRTYGDITRGALAYEIKPDDYHTLPSSQFTVVLTSRVYKKYLPFETKGIAPDQLLDYERSWIDTVVRSIKIRTD
jgi:hypothetical protein